MSPTPHDGAAPSVSAVLPAYNEAAVIAGVVEAADRALESAGIARREVVVVDDGSHDATAAEVERVAANRATVRLVRHAQNRGYGAALRTGFEAASGELVWLMDSDGQFDPADLPLLLDRWSPGTFVAGYRARRSDPLMRRLNHDAFFGLVRVALGPTTLRDVNCAFKLFERRLGVGLHAEGAIISTELVLRAVREGTPILEVAVPHHPRVSGSATGASPHVIARAFAELWDLRRAMRHDRSAARRGTPAP